VGVARRKVVPALLAAAGAGLALAALQQRSLVSVPLAVAAAAVGVPALRTLFPSGTLTARAGLPATVLVRGLLTFGFFGADTFVPLALVAVRHTSTALAGAALTAATVSWTGASWLQSRYVNALGARLFVRVGLVIVVLAIGGTACALLDAVPPAVAVATWAVGGFGIGLVYSALSLTMLREAEPGREGEATAALQLSDNLGVAFGAGIGGAAVAIAAAHGREALGIAVAYTVAAAVALVGALVAARIPK
jgi:MFS family permease